jgi:predicted RNA-binding protein YlxR (DUF448 family)
LIHAGDQIPAEPTQALPENIRQDSPPARARVEKEYKCIQSGENLDKDRLLRFVIGPENTLYPDFSENLPGQSFWCNLYRETLQKAVTENPFGPDVVIPADIMEIIEKGLRNQAISMISMARKAGQLVTGAAKTEQSLRSGKAGVYLTAAIKEADTREKLSFLANQARIVDLFTTDELSQASGTRKVFHAAMSRGGIAERFFIHVKRMNLFRKQ